MSSQNLNTVWSSKLSDDHSEGREHFAPPVLEEGCRQRLFQGQMTIDMLPDDALLEIFHFYKDADPLYLFNFTWRWKPLTQVCRRWRHVVFGSPRRLDLRLLCTNKTPTSKLLDVWPSFPIIVYQSSPFPVVDKNGVENIIAALECRDRISKIQIVDIRGPVLERLVTVLHEPFPVLTNVLLRSTDESVPVLPETFLGGFAPRLQSFSLKGIPFPSRPFQKFSLCFPPIVSLHLEEIPNSGYISPDVMAASLAALPHLEFLTIGFQSPASRLLRSSPPRLTRVALPSLSNLHFSGVSEYFEDLIARIDIPRLARIRIAFFMDLIFNIPQLCNFIVHKQGRKPFNQAAIKFSGRTIEIVLEPPTWFELEVRCERPDWQLSSMTQIFSQQLPFVSHVEQLEISDLPWRIPRWKDDPDMDSSQWLELFRLFISAQSLYISEELLSPVARALQDLTGQMATEVFPMLRTLFLEGFQPPGPVHEAIESFATARQLYHRPVVIQRWHRWGPPQLVVAPAVQCKTGN